MRKGGVRGVNKNIINIPVERILIKNTRGSGCNGGNKPLSLPLFPLPNPRLHTSLPPSHILFLSIALIMAQVHVIHGWAERLTSLTFHSAPPFIQHQTHVTLFGIKNQALGHHENSSKPNIHHGTLSLHGGCVCKLVIFGGLDFAHVESIIPLSLDSPPLPPPTPSSSHHQTVCCGA